MHRTALLLLFAVVAGVALWLLRFGDEVSGEATGGGAAPPPDPVTAVRTGSDEAVRRLVESDPEAAIAAFDAALADLRRAIRAGDRAPEAAAAMRRLLRLDEGSFAAAAALVLADDTAADLRRALVLVLGSIAHEQTDMVLLEALSRFEDDAETVRTLIAALGAMREPPEEDDVFDLDAAPHFGFAGPGGMGVTVRRTLDDGKVQQVLGQLLLDQQRADVRRAAAEALRFSLVHDPVRARFLTAVQIEGVDGTASLLAETLALWTRDHPGIDNDQVLGAIVARADQSGFEEYRLRLETGLEGARLPADMLARVRSWTHGAQPFELRSFAFTMLARQGEVHADDRRALEQGLQDADGPIRDLCARLLGSLPHAASTVTALMDTYRAAPEWNVRSTALGALAAILPAAQARAFLQTATNDADPRVRRQVERLLARLGS